MALRCFTEFVLQLLLLLLLLLTKGNYETCSEVNPTLAGRHQRNHHAAKPN